jgi:membrane-associated HD superfamily phosphohydrolase
VWLRANGEGAKSWPPAFSFIVSTIWALFVNVHFKEKKKESCAQCRVASVQHFFSLILFLLLLAFSAHMCKQTDVLLLNEMAFLLPVLKEEWDLTIPLQGLLGSATYVGMVFGAYFWGRYSDKHG